MTAPSTPTPSKTQVKLTTMADGLAGSSYSLLNSLVVLGATLAKAEIISKLRAYIALYVAVAQAKASYTSAVASRTAAEATLHAFYNSLVIALNQALGGNTNLLLTLGIAPPKARKAASSATKAIANEKRKQTRQARGIMSKKQRQAISATPTPQVQVIGLGSPAAPLAAPEATAPSASTGSGVTPQKAS